MASYLDYDFVESVDESSLNETLVNILDLSVKDVFH